MSKPAILLGILLIFSAPLVAEEASQSDANATTTLVWPDGTRYVGGVKDGKRWGKGTIFWQDGTRFIGNFENDLRSGPGTMILQDGTVYNGYFENDELVESVASQVSQPEAAAPVVTLQPDPTSATARVETPPDATGTEETISVPATEPEQLLTEAIRQDVEAAIDSWASNWAAGDVAAYLGHYSADFKVPGGKSRSQWEGLRRSRLSRPDSIEIKIAYDKFELNKPDEITVQFLQTYRSNIYSDKTNKQLVLRNEAGVWRILSETSL